jgi:hypothetical protein
MHSAYLVPVSLFDHKPERCSFGHQLWRGMAQVGRLRRTQLYKQRLPTHQTLGVLHVLSLPDQDKA